MQKPTFLKQKNMIRVLYALIPVLIVAIYYFGWRIVAVLIASTLSCFITEWIMANKRRGKVSIACFVTAGLYALSLPPLIPFWIVVVGAVIAILFAKEAFGGFGKNVFNPAIVGRAFVFVCFPIEMTSQFVPSFKGFPGGFAFWSFHTLKNSPAYITEAGLNISDAITTATPMFARRDFGFTTDIFNLLTGNIAGTFTYREKGEILAAGSCGEVCAAIIIVSALYLIVTKTAQWRLMISTLIGAAGATIILRSVLGIEEVPSLLFTLLSGGCMFAAVFMVTDPISAPKLPLSQWIYGAIIGMLIVFFRYKAVFVGGVGFAILIGNMFAPSLDLWIKRTKPQRHGAKTT